ncbi:hypothetical protein KCU91_g4411, partial [Aureobasidium melanogenum]
MPPFTRTQARTELEKQLDARAVSLQEAEDRLERAKRRCEWREDEISILRQAQKRLIQERDRYQERAKTLSRRNDGLLQQYKHRNSFGGTSDDQMQQKNDEIARLQEEVQRYKATITKSTRVHGQLSDTRIQTKMNDLFSAVRNWAVEVTRREKPAKDLYNLVPTDSMVAQQRKAQWVLLTRELLQGEHSIDDQANKQVLSELVEDMQTNLSILSSTLDVQVIVNELRAAVEPHIGIVQALYQQEAEYSLKLEEAVDGNALRRIDLSIMQEVNGEDEGENAACFFPMLIKKTFENDIKGESVIVCKMKVLALS